MKVFVAGATGVVGRRAVRQLVTAGFTVTAIARTEAKADLVRGLGATPVPVDLFDATALGDAVAGHDVVCNLATHIPPLTKTARASAWAENERIRTVGSTNLVDAALAGGATRYIQESITFSYDDAGDSWLDESAPQTTTPLTASVQAAEANAARFTASGGTGIVLRFALFYGSESTHTEDMIRLVRAGIGPFVGDPDGYQSMVHLDDAASAVVAALSAPAGIYNVAEDDPGTRRTVAAAMALALGTPVPWIAPAVAAKLGGAPAASLSRSQRVSNRALRAATGWAPRYPDPWQGWASVATPAPTTSTRGRMILVKASLAYLAVQAASLGLWATFAPHSWYAHFPGFGHDWVSASGPYDQHLVTDVGAFSLALLLLTLVAFGSRSRAMMRTAGGAWVVSALPHFLFHLTHRGTLGTGDYITSVSGLGLQVILGLVCLIGAPAVGNPVPAGVGSPFVPPEPAGLAAESAAALGR